MKSTFRVGVAAGVIAPLVGMVAPVASAETSSKIYASPVAEKTASAASSSRHCHSGQNYYGKNMGCIRWRRSASGKIWLSSEIQNKNTAKKKVITGWLSVTFGTSKGKYRHVILYKKKTTVDPNSGHVSYLYSCPKGYVIASMVYWYSKKYNGSGYLTSSPFISCKTGKFVYF